jgi:alkylated DNA repair dioxygenase AlkB
MGMRSSGRTPIGGDVLRHDQQADTQTISQRELNVIDVKHPVGLALLEDFVSTVEADAFLKSVDDAPWRTDLLRRVQHYGYRYDYRARTIDRSMYLGPLPEWTAPFMEKIQSTALFSELPDQLIVNEYLPGQGITPHVDCVPCFGPVVVSLSLGSTCSMELSRAGSSIDILLPLRSLLVLSGEARFHWKHGIRARRSDTYNGVRHPRGRRVSFTFRKISAKGSVE